MLWLLAGVFLAPAHALITGGADEELNVQGLPQGALTLINHRCRVAWMEGPPFGGGQYHLDYVGGTSDLQDAIGLFAKIDSARKRIIVQAGQGHSQWLSISDKSKKQAIDWQVVVWNPKNWQQLRGAKIGLLPPGQEGDSPPTTLTVFVTERIDWKSIKIPLQIDVIDERLAAAGLADDQGAALRASVTDLDGHPIPKATIIVGKEPDRVSGQTDSDGKCMITKIPAGNHRITVRAPGHASLDAYYHSLKQTTFRELQFTLAAEATTRVRVVDQDDRPLSQIKIRVANCKDKRGNHYRSAGKQEYTSDDRGELTLDDLPQGQLQFGSRTSGYYHNPVLNSYSTDDDVITLRMQPTGSVKVLVVTAAGVPVTSKYIVEINEQGDDPDTGGKAGSWGGSANIGSTGSYEFKNIPPGDYVVSGKPNPGPISARTVPVVVRIKGRDRHTIKLTAR